MKRVIGGALARCDECKIGARNKIVNSEPFEINEELNNPRQGTLEVILGFLEDYSHWSEHSSSLRKKYTELFLEHGQFSQSEIDNVFENNSDLTYDYSDEFKLEHPEMDFEDIAIRSHFEDLQKQGILQEKKYHFPGSDCESRKLYALCPADFEYKVCPDCGQRVSNTPDNVASLTYELLCPSCFSKRNGPFDGKGLVIKGFPWHHGYWGGESPEFEFSGTDYFFVLHPNCKKSSRDDGMGLMLVNGVWFDDSKRVVLGLECQDCGAKNALKPAIFRTNDIPLLNVNGAEWKRIQSRIDGLIEKGECDQVEFKSTLRWDVKLNKLNKELPNEVVEAIIGFANGNGGTLLIGVDDEGKPLGLENDYKTLGKRSNSDGFEGAIRSYLNEKANAIVLTLVSIEFDTSINNVQNKEYEICIVDVKPSPNPVFLKNGSFVVRIGNRTQHLSPEEAHRYIGDRWKT